MGNKQNQQSVLITPVPGQFGIRHLKQRNLSIYCEKIRTIHDITIFPQMTVADIKFILIYRLNTSSKSQIPISAIILQHKGLVLEDDVQIEKLNIENNLLKMDLSIDIENEAAEMSEKSVKNIVINKSDQQVSYKFREQNIQNMYHLTTNEEITLQSNHNKSRSFTSKDFQKMLLTFQKDAETAKIDWKMNLSKYAVQEHKIKCARKSFFNQSVKWYSLTLSQCIILYLSITIIPTKQPNT